MKLKALLITVLGCAVIGFTSPPLYAPNDDVTGKKFQAHSGALNAGFEPASGNTPAWASVRKQQSHTNVDIGLGSSFRGNTSLAVANPNPHSRLAVTPVAPLTNQLTNLGLTGGGEELDPKLDEVIDMQINAIQFGASILTLNVKLLPLRTAQLDIYRVWDIASEGANARPGGPANNETVTDADIVTRLNSLYSQAGVSFNLAKSEDLNIAYDINPRDQKVDDGEATTIINQIKNIQPGNRVKLILMNTGKINTTPTNPVGDRAINSPTRSISIVFVSTCAATNTDVKLAAGHEVGHCFKLTVRAPDPGRHDAGQAPNGTELLMKPGHGAANPGEWLPHEDWHEANDRAGAYESQP